MGRDLSHTLHLYQRVLTQPPRDRYLAMRELGKQDLFFLLVVLCKRRDIARQWLLDRCDEVRARPDGMLDLWAREHYKDLADSTPMLTANRGWTMHGELAVGDAVFSPSGKPVRVLALSERYSDSECYRVTFHDGASLVAGAGHLWRLRSKMRRRIANSELRRIEWGERVVRTVDLVQSTRGDVGVTEPIEFPVRQLPLHPYVLGQWLGDGHSTNGRITSGDDEVFDRIERLGYRLSSSSKPITRNVYGIMPVLRSIGVLGAKRIPHDYMTASVHQRMELMRGLMDSDGHCNTRGTATFVNTNDDLAEDVRELAAGLGLRPRKRFYKSKVGADFWQVSFQAHKDRNPFWLQRKASRAIDSGGWRETRNVMSVERVTSVPTRCIQVEGGMYLAGLELVPTHNSSIITYGLTIQSVLRDPETTVGIFSHTRPIAKGFLVQIKRELESNVELQRLYPEILWVDPAKESPRWSEDGGLVVKRLGNPKEATIEAYGLVDGQPVGKHYKVMVFDDIVTRENAASPEMRRKTLEGLSLAQALGTDGGVKRYVGTRYHYADAYADIVDRGTARPRVYPAEVDGRPVLLSAERMADLRRDMVAYVFSAQMMLDPKGDESVGFRSEWRRIYEGEVTGNTYAVADPANSKKKDSDYTAAFTMTAGEDGNWYIRDLVYQRLSLDERVSMYIDLHRKWRPLQFGIEQYGMMADATALRMEQKRLGYRFDVVELGGKLSKPERISRLEPLYRQGKIYCPPKIMKDMGAEGIIDVLGRFHRDEYDAWPYSGHDDGLDALSRICDMRVMWPASVGRREAQRDALVADPLAA